jgi:hypothetical protein
MKEPWAKKQAKERQQGGQGGVLLPQNSAEASEVREQMAEKAGVSHDTYTKAVTVIESDDEDVSTLVVTSHLFMFND